MKRLVIALAFLISLPATAAPSYEWVDVERWNSGNFLGVSRLVYQSSNPAETIHTYRVTAAGGGLLGSGLITEAQLVSTDLGGVYNFDMHFVHSGNTHPHPTVTHNEPNPTPSDNAELAPGTYMRAVAWGPVREDAQNLNGEHEEREWIKVRVSWNGNAQVSAGTWTGTLTLDVPGSKTYAGQATVETWDGTLNQPMNLGVAWNADHSITASPASAGALGTQNNVWGKGANHGDYTGPLDIQVADPSDFNMFEFVILEQGPTVGGDGNDGIGDGEGIDDGGTPSDPDDPDNADPEPENQDTPSVDCLEQFFVDFLAVPSIAAFYNLTTVDDSEAANVFINIPIPGGNDRSIHLTSDPMAGEIGNISPEVRSTVETFRLGLRTTLVVLFGWITLRAVLGVLIRW